MGRPGRGLVAVVLLAVLVAGACGSSGDDEGRSTSDEQADGAETPASDSADLEDDAGTEDSNDSAADGNDETDSDAASEPGEPRELAALDSYTAHLINDRAGIESITQLSDGRIVLFATGNYQLEACGSAPPGGEPSCFTYDYPDAVRLVDPDTLEDIAVVPAVPADAGPIELDGARLLMTSLGTNLNIWDPAKDYGPTTTELPAGSPPPPPPPPQFSFDVLAMLKPTGYVASIADKDRLADGGLVLALHADGVQIWDLNDLELPVAAYVVLVDDFDYDEWAEETGNAFPRPAADNAAKVIVLSDGRVAAGYDSGVVRVWDPSDLGAANVTDANGVPVWNVADPALLDAEYTFDEPVSELVALDDGRLAVATSRGMSIFDPSDSSVTEVCEGSAGSSPRVLPLSDGLLAIAVPGAISICDIADPASPVVATFSEHLGAPSAGLIELADGRVMSASRHAGDSVYIWDPRGS